MSSINLFSAPKTAGSGTTARPGHSAPYWTGLWESWWQTTGAKSQHPSAQQLNSYPVPWSPCRQPRLPFRPQWDENIVGHGRLSSYPEALLLKRNPNLTQSLQWLRPDSRALWFGPAHLSGCLSPSGVPSHCPGHSPSLHGWLRQPFAASLGPPLPFPALRFPRCSVTDSFREGPENRAWVWASPPPEPVVSGNVGGGHLRRFAK